MAVAKEVPEILPWKQAYSVGVAKILKELIRDTHLSLRREGLCEVRQVCPAPFLELPHLEQ